MNSDVNPNNEPARTPISNPSKPVYGTPIPGQTAQVVLIQQPNSTIRRWINWLGWMGFLFCAIALMGMSTAFKDYFDTSHGVQEKYFSGAKANIDGKVAIINVSGVIGQGTSFVKHQIDRIRDDENVKAVIVRVNSPGGTITGSDYIFHHLTKLKEERKIPMVVSMGSIATSGGYYVAMAVGDQEKSIYAEPTTTTGSIGVLIPHYDVSGLMEQYKVKDDTLATHPRKLMLSMTKPITEDHRTVLDEYLQSAFTRFKDVIKQGRPAFRDNPASLDELATGEIFTATKAKDKGLIDELGFIEDAISRAVELAGLDEKKTRVVEYSAPFTLSNALGLASAQQVPSFNMSTVLELATPKAYYISTSLPVLVSLPGYPGGI